jgi:hypothetical protein
VFDFNVPFGEDDDLDAEFENLQLEEHNEENGSATSIEQDKQHFDDWINTNIDQTQNYAQACFHETNEVESAHIALAQNQVILHDDDQDPLLEVG